LFSTSALSLPGKIRLVYIGL